MRSCVANKNHTFIFQTLKINCIVMLFNIFRTELICARFTWIFRSSVLIMPINRNQGRAKDSLWIVLFGLERSTRKKTFFT